MILLEEVLVFIGYFYNSFMSGAVIHSFEPMFH